MPLKTLVCKQGCGREFASRAWLEKHEAGCSGLREKPAAPPAKKARPATIPTPEPPQAVPAADRPATGQGGKDGRCCEDCHGLCLHGLNFAQVQLVERGVRLGLTLRDAAEFVESAQAAGR